MTMGIIPNGNVGKNYVNLWLFMEHYQKLNKFNRHHRQHPENNKEVVRNHRMTIYHNKMRIHHLNFYKLKLALDRYNARDDSSTKFMSDQECVDIMIDMSSSKKGEDEYSKEVSKAVQEITDYIKLKAQILRD